MEIVEFFYMRIAKNDASICWGDAPHKIFWEMWQSIEADLLYISKGTFNK